MVRKVVKYSSAVGLGYRPPLGSGFAFLFASSINPFVACGMIRVYTANGSLPVCRPLLCAPLAVRLCRSFPFPPALAALAARTQGVNRTPRSLSLKGLLTAPVPAAASSLLLDPTQPHPAELQPRTAPGQAARFVRPQLHNSLNPISIP